MAVKMYGRTALIGGTAGCLDAIDGSRLNDGDVAVVADSGAEYFFYRLNATAGSAESSPYVISPDTNAGNKRWLLSSLKIDHIHLTNNLVVPSGKGIDFAATSDASGMTAEVFDDYEHGDCAIGVSFGNGTTGITYQSGYTTGKYVKKGKEVSVTGIVFTSSNGSSTGAARITGLPFVNGSGNKYTAAAALSAASLSFVGQLSGAVETTEYTISLYQTAEAGSFTPITEANWPDSCYVKFSVTYITD